MVLKVKIGNTTFKNPIWVASGTFGYGEEFKDFLKLEDIGAIVTKTVTLKAREGNAPPRTVETPSGMLNSIGLENKGIDSFIKESYPSLKKLKTNIVISIAGSSKKEIIECVKKISKVHSGALELNLSCPNVTHKETKHRLIAQDPDATKEIVSSARKETDCTIIVKLTPNVTDITAIAASAEAGGADAISLVNTYLGMAVDVEARQPILGNITGGLSGPAIKPMALKAVWDVYNSVSIPVVGMGGIMTGEDVVEFMLCGARAVQIGTANLASPDACSRITKEFKAHLKKNKITTTSSLIGKLRTKKG